MPEGELHGRLCELIYQILLAAAGAGATVGKDHFVYFDGADARRRCAPDAFVKLDVPKRGKILAWKTWERGTPELCVEILSRSDTKEKLTLPEKLARFHTMGTSEVVAFDADARVGRRLRAWDRVSGDLVERVIVGELTPCRTLGGWFVIVPHEPDEIEAALRLAKDPAGKDLVPTALEIAEAEKERAEAEKDDALAEVARLRRVLADAQASTAASARRPKRRRGAATKKSSRRR